MRAAVQYLVVVARNVPGISRMSSALLISQSADDGRQKRKSFPALDLKALPYFKSHGSRG